MSTSHSAMRRCTRSACARATNRCHAKARNVSSNRYRVWPPARAGSTTTSDRYTSRPSWSSTALSAPASATAVRLVWLKPSRLVARMRSRSQLRNNLVATSAHASMRCSQLSRSSSWLVRPSVSHNVSISGVPGCSRTPSTCAIAWATSWALPTARARQATHRPGDRRVHRTRLAAPGASYLPRPVRRASKAASTRAAWKPRRARPHDRQSCWRRVSSCALAPRTVPWLVLSATVSDARGTGYPG
jgi:hypothetical protein